MPTSKFKTWKINTILPKSPNIDAIKLPEQKKETDTKCCK